MKLTDKQKDALSRGLEQHIPSKNNRISIQTQFEQFYQRLPTTEDQTAEAKTEIKSKVLETYTKYMDIETPYVYEKEVSELKKNKNISILKQDKGRGVVILNKQTYNNKCNQILQSQQFTSCEEDPTKTIEGKVQRAVRKIKPHLTPTEYNKIYPTGSNPGRFYGTAKMHKLKPDHTVEDLPLRPIISNIGTATYQLAKYLAKLLSPLAQSDYTVTSTDNFINRVRNLVIPLGYKLISFDVVSLFTNVPLEYTIDVAIKRIYNQSLVHTDIPLEDMRKLLLLCTKNVPFTFNGIVYSQTDGVAMSSPLGPVQAGICMTELEQTLLPQMDEYMTPWMRYVDDTVAAIHPDHIKDALKTLNSFNKRIQFTHEIEKDCTLPFLDVKLIRKEQHVDTTVYRKPTTSNIYLHWHSFAPKSWKISTLKSMILRAYKICSNDVYRKQKLKKHFQNLYYN